MRLGVGKRVGGVYIGTSVSGSSLAKGIYWFFAWPFYLAYYMLVWPFIKLYQYSKKDKAAQSSTGFERGQSSSYPPNRPSGSGNNRNLDLILLSIFLPFVAIPMLWFYPQWKEQYSKRFRTILTAVLSVYLILGIVGVATNPVDDEKPSSSYVTSSPTPAPTESPELLASPSPEATVSPTAEPTAEPTPGQTPKPTSEPTPEPTEKPTPEPTAEPTEEPSTQSETVWLSRYGDKYHCDPNCGNMKNPIESTLDEAIASGREPCEKCYG